MGKFDLDIQVSIAEDIFIVDIHFDIVIEYCFDKYFYWCQVVSDLTHYKKEDTDYSSDLQDIDWAAELADYIGYIAIDMDFVDLTDIDSVVDQIDFFDYSDIEFVVVVDWIDYLLDIDSLIAFFFD